MSLCFNPYFTGLPILIGYEVVDADLFLLFQSLFYWITYSYLRYQNMKLNFTISFNPYFTGLPILILTREDGQLKRHKCFNPYFTGLPILINNGTYEYPVILLFQSLFYWITYSYLMAKLREIYVEPLFQSLFYWITYSYVLKHLF